MKLLVPFSCRYAIRSTVFLKPAWKRKENTFALVPCITLHLSRSHIFLLSQIIYMVKLTYLLLKQTGLWTVKVLKRSEMLNIREMLQKYSSFILSPKVLPTITVKLQLNSAPEGEFSIAQQQLHFTKWANQYQPLGLGKSQTE